MARCQENLPGSQGLWIIWISGKPQNLDNFCFTRDKSPTSKKVSKEATGTGTISNSVTPQKASKNKWIKCSCFKTKPDLWRFVFRWRRKRDWINSKKVSQEAQRFETKGFFAYSKKFFTNSKKADDSTSPLWSLMTLSDQLIGEAPAPQLLLAIQCQQKDFSVE